MTNPAWLLLISMFSGLQAVPSAMAQAGAETSPSGSGQSLAAAAPTPAPSLVTESFKIPERIGLQHVRLVKVDPTYAVQDYQALLAARLQIRQDLGTDWPADNLTLAENEASLVNDLKAFNQRSNFTYHLLEPASGRVIGCLYISHSSSTQYQATVYYWLIPEYDQSRAHPALRADVQKWLATSWPFAAVDYSLNRELPVASEQPL